MNDTRLTTKVGFFVVVALGVLTALLLVFSKGSSLLAPSYRIQLKAENVGGLKARSAVLISGVEVGSVIGTELSDDGRGVTILLRIKKRYPIHRDARFLVQQIGLLGDQYVVVYPTRNEAPLLKDGDEVHCESPFNLQEVARTTVGFIERVDDATRMLKDTIERINHRVLTDRTLSNLATGVDNFRLLSDRAILLADSLNTLVQTNSPAIFTASTNLARFTGDLNLLAGELRETVAENRSGISNTVAQLRQASASVGALALDLEAGRGVAGGLLRDDQLRRDLSNTLANLAVAASNVANYGLLYKPRRAKKDTDSSSREILRSPKYP